MTETSTTQIIHRADDRGHANHGWLDSYHTFSFADYYNRDRMNFGVLRVLNDDIIASNNGFGLHPHDNMEIITVPFSGELEHKDNMGHTEFIRAGDVQVMSAGTGLTHSEYNRSRDTNVNFAQIWIYPNQRNVEPRYDQKTFVPEKRKNKFQVLVSPKGEDGSLWIHQDAWFLRTSLDAGVALTHNLRRQGNGVYVFVIDGDVDVNETRLTRRDGIGITESEPIVLTANSNADILLMDVPMNVK